MSGLIIGVIGFLIGSIITLVLMCLLYTAREADDRCKRMREEMQYASEERTEKHIGTPDRSKQSNMKEG